MCVDELRERLAVRSARAHPDRFGFESFFDHRGRRELAPVDDHDRAGLDAIAEPDLERAQARLDRGGAIACERGARRVALLLGEARDFVEQLPRLEQAPLALLAVGDVELGAERFLLLPAA